MDKDPILDRLDRDAISGRLQASRQPRARLLELPVMPPGNPRPAAVLLPLFRYQDAWQLLFIRRAKHAGDYHSGEVAFPGGSREPADADATATALREAREEIGLEPGRVALLGELRPMHTLSNYLVTPVIGEIPWPLDLAPNPVEVARVFSIPLAWLGNSANRQVRVWPTPGHPEARHIIFYDEFDQELLWGVSAYITVNFLTALFGLDPETPMAHGVGYPLPKFDG